jgi:hypothetical protein
MTSKMHAGLVAGGFGAALVIVLALSTPFSPQLAYFASLALLFGLGALSGLLAAHWLDLNDYGRQQAAGAIAGLVAAGLTEVADLFLRLVFASISKDSPTSTLANAVLFRIPKTSEAATMLLMIIVNLLLYFVYLLVVIGISSAVASLAGRAKSAEALQALLQTRQPAFFDQEEEEEDEPLGMDPALLPFMRPEYSPFVPEEPPRRSPTQPRRSGPEGFAPDRQEWFAEEESQPPAPRSQTAPRRNSSSLYPSGVPARGPMSGPVQRRPSSGAIPRRTTSGLRPPGDVPWPRPQDKDY